MNTRIIEAHQDGQWLKVVVATFDIADIRYRSTLPGYEQLPLLRVVEKAQPNSVWILDLSTGEGAAFDLDSDPNRQIEKIDANL